MIVDRLPSRLPLPVSQLVRRAHNAKTPLERHLGAFYLFEATLKLLASVAVVEYAAAGERDEQILARLRNLARPSLGHWWEFTRTLIPVLAERGDAGFASVNELLQKKRRHDLPLATGLDQSLKEVLTGTRTAQSSVRLPHLVDRLVQYRNQQMGHGAAGQKSATYHDRIGKAMLAGLSEIFRHLNATAGRQLIYIDDVRRTPRGDWAVDGLLLSGATAERLPTREMPAAQLDRLPRPKRVYVAHHGASGASTFHMLHPFLLYDPDSEECFFLNGRKGRAEAEYLCYSSGRIQRAGLEDQRELLARLLGISVSEASLNQWAMASLAEESPEDGAAEDDDAETIGEYELVSRIGRGGMGVVYRAVQPSLSREVALKCLLRTGDEKSEARFAREIRALGRVDHPNLVKIYTSGADGDRWYYAMELVDGVDLSRVLQKLAETSMESLGEAQWQHAVSTAYSDARTDEKPVRDDADAPAARDEFVPPADVYLVDDSVSKFSGGGADFVRRVVDIVRQVALAAHALHRRGVLHRDIKPGNIMLLSDGRRAVLMDLGLAKLLDEADGQLTRTRQFVGTLRYASPEQVFAAGNIDARSDVYSLGVTLWELLTLRPMYGATDDTPTPRLMQQIQFDEPERVSRYNSSVAANLEAVVQKCVEKNPRHRYQSAKELADDLARILEEKPVLAKSLAFPGRAARMLRRRRKALSITTAVVGVQAALLWGLWTWWTFKSDQIPKPVPALTAGETVSDDKGSELPDTEATAETVPDGDTQAETPTETSDEDADTTVAATDGTPPAETTEETAEETAAEETQETTDGDADDPKEDKPPIVTSVEMTPTPDTDASSERIIRGRLEAGDEKLDDGEFVDRYQFYAVEGAQITLDLTSGDFDTYIFCRNADPEFQPDNDDFQEDTDRSRLDFAAPLTGYYAVSVTSFDAGETGAYELKIIGASEPSEPPTPISRRETGELAKGDDTLDNGEYFDVYDIEVRAGQRGRIRLRSTEFDPWLLLVGPLRQQVEENDDLDEDRSLSGLDVVFRNSGPYQVVVTSYKGGETGRYELEIEVE